MGHSGLRVERRGPVAELVLDRPEKQNALSRAMWRSLPEVCDGLDGDPAVRVVVVRGEPPAFSAGADIAEFGEVFADMASAHAYNELVQAALGRIERLTKPTIAQIAGSCIGGGCALAAACDLRFAADDARFGITPARLGLAYSLGDVKRLMGLVGASRAKDLLFSGRLVDAAEALRIGLVDRVVPSGELAGAVDGYAQTLAAASGNSQLLLKQLVHMVLDGTVQETEASRGLRDGAVDHPDFSEGRRAFLEKRRPRFA
jgi:enoyl-CoA hydratase/carnithine racemase